MWIIAGGLGGRKWARMESTDLIRIMFKRTVVTHVSHTIEICVSLINIVHIGTIVLLIQYAWKTIENIQ